MGEGVVKEVAESKVNARK